MVNFRFRFHHKRNRLESRGSYIFTFCGLLGQLYTYVNTINTSSVQFRNSIYSLHLPLIELLFQYQKNILNNIIANMIRPDLKGILLISGLQYLKTSQLLNLLLIFVFTSKYKHSVIELLPNTGNCFSNNPKSQTKTIKLCKVSFQRLLSLLTLCFADSYTKLTGFPIFFIC